MLYTKAAYAVSKYLFTNGYICEDDIAVFEYGFESATSLIINLLLFLVVSFLFRLVSESVIYLGVYIAIRSFSGGYHANSHFKCSVLSVLTIIIVDFLIILIPTYLYIIIIPLLACFSCITTILFSGIDNIHKPIPIKTRQKNRVISVMIVFACSIISVCLCYICKWVALSTILGALIASMFMVIGKLTKIKEDH